MAQLGAFEALPDATAAWDALRVKAPDILANYSPIILKVEHGDRVFFRLRVIIADMPAACAFCEALLAQDISCIPVQQK